MFQIQKDAPVGAEVHRILLEQLDLATARIQTGAMDQATVTHEVRKALKRWRCALSLARAAAGSGTWRRLDRIARDLRTGYSGRRDFDIMLALLDSHPEWNIEGLRRRIEDAAAGADGLAPEPEAALEHLAGLRAAVATLDFGDLTVKGIRRRYVKALRQESRRRLTTGRRLRIKRLHAWRRSVKRLSYLSDLVAAVEFDQTVMRPEARELGRLGDWLGLIHDQWVLRDFTLDLADMGDADWSSLMVATAGMDFEIDRLWQAGPP